MNALTLAYHICFTVSRGLARMTIAKKAAYTTGLFAVFFCFYFAIQLFISQSQFDLILDIDKEIPFIPEFVWVYHSLYFQIFLVMVFLVKEEHLFFKTFWACIFSSVLLLTFYLLLPSFYPRYQIDLANMSAQVVNFTRMLDGANNTFPSGHVVFSWLMFITMLKSKLTEGRLGLVFLFMLWASGISLSTLVIKQHYIVDVVSGCLLAFMVYHLIERFNVPQALSHLFIKRGGSF